MRFRTTIELGGRTATGFAVTDEVVDAPRQRRIAEAVEAIRPK